jgi:hypothetical protein
MDFFLLLGGLRDELFEPRPPSRKSPNLGVFPAQLGLEVVVQFVDSVDKDEGDFVTVNAEVGFAIFALTFEGQAGLQNHGRPQQGPENHLEKGFHLR